MKSELEIRLELCEFKEKEKYYRKLHEEGRIDKETLRTLIRENKAFTLALKWVLGEADRFD
ncbi:hypothetical protein BCB4_0187 [Bacillus phage B4]|nr:hypothetical protein BCB4_0187 [Bacillus phage B4]AEZ65980.1 hypothetical protein BCB4_0187 [Bacillus phage B4]